MELINYISTQMNGKIERRGNSLLIPAITTATGIVVLCLAFTAHLSDIIQTTLLTIGFILVPAGLIWVVLCLSKTLWHYYYLPTSSPMQSKTLYLSAEEFHNCNEMLENGNIKELKTLSLIPSSNVALCIIYSRDHSIALLQAGRMDTSRLEPTSPVVTLTGADVGNIVPLLR